MVRTGLWVLRQRRYARLAVLMAFIAAGCVAAGTWQISRYEQTARINRAISANAHAAAVAFTALPVPLVGAGPAPGREAIRYRTVTVSGTYVPGVQQFVPDQSVAGRSGFYVVNALRTTDGVLMVVRGFVPVDGDSTRPPAVAPPPAGVQNVVGRLQTAATTSDNAQDLGRDQISSVNPGEQAGRLGGPVFNAYLTLSGRQSQDAGLSALPGPDLSNPAGGAVQPQHLAYIVQWYLFALLALAAPFAIARSEVREARQKFLGIDPDAGDFGAEPTAPEMATALDSSGPSTDNAIAVRERGELLRRDAAKTQRLERAERLASRYGRSLNTGRAWTPDPSLGVAGDAGPGAREPDYVVANSAERPHRSPDAYHGAYNDYLWQLAMADGDMPHVAVPGADPAPRTVIAIDMTDNDPAARPLLAPAINPGDGRVIVTSLGPTGPTGPTASHGPQEEGAPDRSEQGGASGRSMPSDDKIHDQ